MHAVTGEHSHRTLSAAQRAVRHDRNDAVNYGHQYTTNDYPFSPEMTLGMDLREITIGQVLQKVGYKTGVVGKWDGGRAKRFLPLQRGFDFFYGFASTGIDYWTHERYGVPSMMRGNDDINEEGYATDLFRREAVKFIRENKSKPFFLYVPFNAPHSASNLRKDSYQAPKEFIDLYPEPKDKRAEDRTKYMAMVTSMDAAIGALLDTLVIFFSDNGGGGPADNHPLRGRKGDAWEGGIRLPFIARWPGKIPAGKVTDEFLTSLEIFPTFLSVAKANRRKGSFWTASTCCPSSRAKQIRHAKTCSGSAANSKPRASEIINGSIWRKAAGCSIFRAIFPNNTIYLLRDPKFSTGSSLVSQIGKSKWRKRNPEGLSGIINYS